jgi:hypothetical protein
VRVGDRYVRICGENDGFLTETEDAIKKGREKEAMIHTGEDCALLGNNGSVTHTADRTAGAF